jgi:hypothetical protein
MRHRFFDIGAGAPAVGGRAETEGEGGRCAQTGRLVTQRPAENRCRAENENTFQIDIQVKKQ